MAIFLPVAFMEGTIGKFFFQFGVTVGVAVFLSLICSLTLTPMLCAYFLKLHGKQHRLPNEYAYVLLAVFVLGLVVAFLVLFAAGWEAAMIVLLLVVACETIAAFVAARRSGVAP